MKTRSYHDDAGKKTAPKPLFERLQTQPNALRALS